MPEPKSTFPSVRSAFFTGLLLLAPLAVTVTAFVWLVSQVGGPFHDLFFFWVPARLLEDPSLRFIWNTAATLIVALFTTALGYLSHWVLGKYFGNLAERFILSIPGVSGLYNTVKQFVQTFGGENRAAFSKVVLVPFPHAGTFTVGFLTNESAGEASKLTGEDLVSVFVPTTPNPTSGFLLMVPRKDVRELSMSVKDGMKFIISGGSVLPASETTKSNGA